MNRSKKLYILLGILAVACIATFAVMQMEERKEQIKETGAIPLLGVQRGNAGIPQG